MGIIVAQGMAIHRQLPMAIHRLHMVTQLQPTVTAAGMVITDRGTIPYTGTMVVITVEEAITDVDGSHLGIHDKYKH